MYWWPERLTGNVVFRPSFPSFFFLSDILLLPDERETKVKILPVLHFPRRLGNSTPFHLRIFIFKTSSLDIGRFGAKRNEISHEFFQFQPIELIISYLRARWNPKNTPFLFPLTSQSTSCTRIDNSRGWYSSNLNCNRFVTKNEYGALIATHQLLSRTTIR